MFVQVCTNDGKPLFLSHLEIVIGDVSGSGRLTSQCLQAMMQEEMGNRFSWHVTILACVCGHHMSQHMHGDANGVSLGSVQVQPMQDEAQQGLHIRDAENPMGPVRRGGPLKQVLFWLEMFVLGTTTGWGHRGDTAMRLLQ